MSARWQYLIVIFSEVKRQKKSNMGVEGWDLLQSHAIWRPGSTEAEVRTGVNWLHLLNELGDEGWELVECSVLSSTIIDSGHGYSEVSHPLRVRHSFKRQVDEGVQA